MANTENKSKTLKEVYVALGTLIEEHGEEPLKISVPYRNGIGLHYEDIVSVTTHEGIVDIFTTVPDTNDIK